MSITWGAVQTPNEFNAPAEGLAKLTGHYCDGANPSLAVQLEARATLLRADDGREIYSCPVYYRGLARKFKAWAANDARLFREELDRAYRELSGTVIDQLAARRLIAPGQNLNSFLADNQN